MTRRSRRLTRPAQSSARPAGGAPSARSADAAASEPRPAPAGSPPGARTRPVHRSTGPSGAERAGRRERPVRATRDHRSFLERYRTPILGLGIVIVAAAVFGFVFIQSTQKLYACGTIDDPAATPVPSVPAGFIQPDMGNRHLTPGTFQRYADCPPASGYHNATGPQGPIQARYYGPDDATVPQNWVHNLEHGALVVLYSCARGACDAGTLQQLQDFVRQVPASPLCHVPTGNNFSPVVTRFEDMAHEFAALVWDRYLYLDTFDPQTIIAFYDANGERGNPEPACDTTASPSPSPGASATPAASGSESPAASGPASPAASGSTEPSPSPAAPASPSPSG